MRGIARYTPLIALVPVITACHIVPQFSASSSSSATPPTSGASTSGGGSTPSTPSSPATTSPPNTGPLGVLPMPAGAKPWDDNKSTPMGLDAFIKAFYVDSAFTKEKALYTQRGFVSGTIQGWINADGSQQSIAIIKFKGSSGAVSLFDGLTGTLKDTPKPATSITDPADGGVGISDPTIDSLGNANAEIAAHTGAYVIDVHEFTASTPDPAAAKALLLRQYQSLKS
jgi:hypothetical protein